MDAVQALISALQMIGAELYASSHHPKRTPYIEEIGQGYGFLEPQNIRQLLEGDDVDEF
jgi:hypothetical protein